MNLETAFPSHFESVFEIKSSGEVALDCRNILNLGFKLISAKSNPLQSLRITAQSSLILLLLPSLIALKDRLRVELQFEEEKNTNLLDEDASLRKTKKFKELLETNEALEKAGIPVIFSSKVSY